MPSQPELQFSYLHFPHNWDDKHTPRCSALLVKMGSHEFFTWAGLELILLISASQVAKITGVSLQHLAESLVSSNKTKFVQYSEII
jgi:hypothetical protein